MSAGLSCQSPSWGRKQQGAEEVMVNGSGQEGEGSERCLQKSALCFIVNDLKEGANSMLIKICRGNT